MPNALRSQFNTLMASSFLSSIQNQKDKLYYFLGKIEDWGTAGELPPIQPPSLKFEEDVSIRNNIAYFKKIEPGDVTLVTDRYEWTSGVTYTQWDHTQIMDGQNFFVVTDENNVYKCLHNNFNQPSTVKPSGRFIQPLQTTDGYLWKFMYNIPTFKRSRFTSFNYIPVQRSLTDSFYSKGSIENVAILNGGSGYTDSQLTEIVVSGTTTGAGASVTLVVNELGQITGFTSLVGGSGYTAGVKISVGSVTGENAELTAVITAGVITNITIDNPGVGYSASDTVSFDVGGAVLIPKINASGSIVDVIILNSGTGYTTTPTLSFNFLPGADTSAIDGLYSVNPSAILETVMYDGEIKSVLIKDPGVGYPRNTSTSITTNGDGLGLQLSPVVFNGEIVDVIIENPGIGYTTAIITVNGSGSDANLSAIFNTGDYTSEQSVIEQLAVDGAIYSIKTTNGGNGYTGTTTVNIDGDGTGATATAIVVGGTITKINVTSYGSGYSYANIVIDDINRVNLGSALVDAQAYAILPPIKGHGYDAVTELYSKTIAISTAIRTDTIIKTLQQNYRQYGILANPRTLLSNRLSTVDYDLNMYSITVDTIPSIAQDEIITISNKYKYRVVYVQNNTIWIQPIQSTSDKPSGILVTDNGIPHQIQSVLSEPLINKYTGNLLYSANETPFEFSDAQGILVKTYITF